MQTNAKRANLTAYRNDIRSRGNTVVTPRPLYSTYLFRSAVTLAVAAEIELFNTGIGDDLTNFGYAASQGNATRRHTNMTQSGRLPKGTLFEVKAIELILPHDIDEDDLEILQHVEVSWTEKSGARRLNLGQFDDFPQRGGIDYQYNGRALVTAPTTGGTSTSEQRLARFRGPLYTWGGKTGFDIRGSLEDHDQGALCLKFYEAFTPTANFEVKAKFHGIYHQIIENA
ncbi:MAG: hypothetical protein ACOYM9_12955 [Bradymonadia bacterium]